jgi:flagella basal body P-ring formation protein FlgA
MSFFILLAIVAGHSAKSLAGDAATGWQSHAAIRATAQSFLDAYATSNNLGRVQTALGQLDPRLRLSACSQPLDAFMPNGGRVMGNTTVGVRCTDDGGWSIYVAARIDVFGPVLVTRQPLAQGTSIQADALELVERNLSDLPYGYYNDAQAVLGQLTKRTLAAATVITPTMLTAPKLIKRGERVSVVAEQGLLSIRSMGHALSDGKSGDLIKVRAEGSKRVVDGIVVSAGVVKVTL